MKTKFLTLCFAAALLFQAVPAHAVFTLSDNLSEPTSDVEEITNAKLLTVSFGTDNLSYTLTSITLLMELTSTTGNATLHLFTNVSNHPGIDIGTLNSPVSFTTSIGENTFTASELTLSPNSTYWAVLMVQTGTFAWAYANTDNGIGVGFTDTYGRSLDNGSTWSVFTAALPQQMRVLAIPEPSNVVLLFMGCATVLLLLPFKRGKKYAVISRR